MAVTVNYPFQDVVNALQDLIIANFSAIKSAPDYPPENAGGFPFVTVYRGAGTHTAFSQGMMDSVITLVIEIHVSRENLPLAYQTVEPYGDKILVLLRDNPTITSTVGTINWPVSDSGITPLNWGGINTLGYKISVPVTIRQDSS